MPNFVRAGASAALGLLALAAPSSAAPPTPEPPRVLVVSGHGEVNAVPDEASLSAGVVTVAKTAREALSENARAMTQVFAALKQSGVPEKDIRTENFNITPQYPPYNSNDTGERPIVGYQVSNEVVVKVAHIENLGSTIDALGSAGANQMNAISFSIHDAKALTNEARTKAVADAADQASVLARAAHVTLGPILSIGIGENERPILPMRAMALAAPAAPAPTPIAAGEETISADVTITWEIR